jgi:prepilin-type N-terminal cleavage/methylation domain-containing protein/prepilin-type processing-associated H-X9-DG protein
MRRVFENQTGFTLIELMVVMAVIGILSALLLAAVGSAKNYAKRATCLNNLRQINLGLRMYSDDSNDRTPKTTSTNKRDRLPNWTGYKQLMKNYVGLQGASSPQDKLFACPADTFFVSRQELTAIEPKSMHDQPFSDFSSYGFNGGNSVTNTFRGSGGISVTGHLGIAGCSLSSIKNPAKTVLVAEFPAYLPFSWHQPKHYLPFPLGNGIPMFNNSKNMVSFVDGHVSYLKIYWDNVARKHLLLAACDYNPPEGYDYQWTGD